MMHSPLLAFLGALAMLSASFSVYPYKEIAVADGGSIRGKVVFNGQVPLKTIIPTKDADICGKKRKEPQILVDENNGVRDAVVYLKKVKKGKPWGENTANPVLDQEGCNFVPSVQVISKGPVDIINSDPVLHNTHGYYGKRTAFNLALPNKDQKITKQLKKPGLVKVDCDAHGWMLAHIYVADNPYYALTGADGTFEITDIPAGNYTLAVWQKLTGEKEVTMAVDAGKATEITVNLEN